MHQSTISGNKTLGLSVVGTHMIHFSHSNTTQEGASMRGLQASHTLVKPLFLVHSFDYLVRPFKQTISFQNHSMLHLFLLLFLPSPWVGKQQWYFQQRAVANTLPPRYKPRWLLIEGKFYCNVHVQKTVRKQTGAGLLAQVFFWIFPSPI